MSAPIASERPSAFAIAASPIDEREDGQEEELPREPVEHRSMKRGR